uniref:Flavoprotein domain-containing protein n=1 Tax=Panagrellus redivivus TaxID=6233 RepID=A0A7E4UX19_PANRE
MADSSSSPPSKKPKVEEANGSDGAEQINPAVPSAPPTLPKVNRPAFGNKHIFKRSSNKFHLLIGVTGSVATIKLGEVISGFLAANPEKLVIKVIATKSSLHFFEPSELPVEVYIDEDEWSMWGNRGDPVLHIELRKWADAVLIAPMDANTLAKVAGGFADNLLTSVLRAWDFSKLAYFAPAMNTCMWEHPLTYQHMKTLKELLFFKEIPPMEKELICGDKGYGAMAAVPMIVSIVNADIRNKFAVYSS